MSDDKINESYCARFSMFRDALRCNPLRRTEINETSRELSATAELVVRIDGADQLTVVKSGV